MSQTYMSPDELRERFEARGIEHTVTDDPPTYLMRPDVELLLGLSRTTVRKYRMPPPDALVGRKQSPAWFESTIRAWNATRRSPSEIE